MADVVPKARRGVLGPTGDARDEGVAASNSASVLFPMGAASDDAAAARLVDDPCPSGGAGVESSDGPAAVAVECGPSGAGQGIGGAALADADISTAFGMADSSRESEAAHAPAEGAAASAAGAAADGPCAPAALHARVVSMFLGPGRRPRPSGELPATSSCTGGFVLDLRGAVGRLWDDAQDAIKSACAPTPVDEMDVLAWAAADALRGGALLHPTVTNLFGKRLASKAKAVGVAIVAEQRRTADALRDAKCAAAGKPERCELAERVAKAEAAAAAAEPSVRAKAYNAKVHHRLRASPSCGAGARRHRVVALGGPSRWQQRRQRVCQGQRWSSTCRRQSARSASAW